MGYLSPSDSNPLRSAMINEPFLDALRSMDLGSLSETTAIIGEAGLISGAIS